MSHWAFLRASWFWLGLSGFSLFFWARLAGIEGRWALAAGTVTIVSFALAILTWRREAAQDGASRADADVVALRQDLRGLHQELRELRQDGQTRAALLAEIRDRLPPPPR